MRRLLSLALLLAFGLPTVAPALGLTADTASSLPACCRRNGAHHCAMSAAAKSALLQGSHFTTIGTRCPSYPTPAPQLQHHDLALHSSSIPLTTLVSQPAPVSRTTAGPRIAKAGACHQRGPPQHLL